MSEVKVPPSQVLLSDRVPAIGLAEPGRVLWVRDGGWSDVWRCPLTEIAVDGLPEPYRQPERLRMAVLRG